MVVSGSSGLGGCFDGTIEDVETEPGATPPATVEERFAPTNAAVPRLTVQQHHNALVDLLGGDVPAVAIEADTTPYLFATIGASTSTVSGRGVAQFEDAALAAARAAFADAARRTKLIGCEVLTDTCARTFLAQFGRRAFRRPLEALELDGWLAIGNKVAPPGSFLSLEMTVAGMLQAPSFLYRLELGKPDASHPGWNRLDGLELASRLSFFIWSSIPDDALLDAAEKGELDDDTALSKHVDRMLDDPRARPAIRAFQRQWLDLKDLDTLQRDPMKFPDAPAGIGASMRGEIERLLDDVTLEDRDFRDLLDRKTTWVDANLAKLYKLDINPAGGAFERVALPNDGPRAGLLTTAGFLAVNAHPEVTSPTRRGKFVRERLLCESVAPPPPEVSTNLDGEKEMPGEAPKTVREKLSRHRTDPKCAGCHRAIDPIGLGFEDFDPIGAHRTTELGRPVDASGSLDGIDFVGGKALGRLVREDPRMSACVSRQLFRFATGRLEAPNEEPALRALAQTFVGSGHRFRALVHALVKNEAFRFTTEVAK